MLFSEVNWTGEMRATGRRWWWFGYIAWELKLFEWKGIADYCLTVLKGCFHFISLGFVDWLWLLNSLFYFHMNDVGWNLLALFCDSEILDESIAVLYREKSVLHQLWKLTVDSRYVWWTGVAIDGGVKLMLRCITFILTFTFYANHIILLMLLLKGCLKRGTRLVL